MLRAMYALPPNRYENAICKAISVGGDNDIAGSVAETLFGITESITAKGLTYLPPETRRILGLLYQRSGGKLRCQP